MSEKRNIEELFRDQLAGMEADPGPGVWDAIQTRIPSGAEMVAAQTTGFITGKMVAVIAGVSVVAGLTIGYLLGDNEKQAPQEKPVKELVVQSEDENDIAFPEEELNIPNALIIEETTTENGTTTSTRSKLVVKDVSAPGSTAQSWITPADKRKSLTTKTGETPVESANEPNKTINTAPSTTSSSTAVNQDENKQSRIEKSTVPKKLPLAVISANLSGGPAPLYVEFKSVNSSQSIEWNFGDGRTSKEIAPTHKFDEPGSYVVTLTLRDAEGNVSTDQVNIQVREGSVIELPNVFSPNGDGINDVFVCKDCRNLERIQISVMDLSGRIVFYSEQLDFEWNGRDQSGNPVVKGTYLVYYLAYDIYGKEYTKTTRLTVQ